MGGGREFSRSRNFFSLSNSLYEFFLGHSMTIFYDQLTCKNFFHLIFPCANIFFVLRPPPSPHKFSNGPSLIITYYFTLFSYLFSKGRTIVIRIVMGSEGRDFRAAWIFFFANIFLVWTFSLASIYFLVLCTLSPISFLMAAVPKFDPFPFTVNSLYSEHCRDLELVSSLPRVRNS